MYLTGQNYDFEQRLHQLAETTEDLNNFKTEASGYIGVEFSYIASDFLTISKPFVLDEDINGKFLEVGTYEQKPFYKNKSERYLFFNSSTSGWYISTSLNTGNSVFYNINENIPQETGVWKSVVTNSLVSGGVILERSYFNQLKSGVEYVVSGYSSDCSPSIEAANLNGTYRESGSLAQRKLFHLNKSGYNYFITHGGDGYWFIRFENAISGNKLFEAQGDLDYPNSNTRWFLSCGDGYSGVFTKNNIDSYNINVLDIYKWNNEFDKRTLIINNDTERPF